MGCTSTNSVSGNALASIQPTSSNVITNNCFIANAGNNNNNLNNNNAGNNGNSSADVNLLKVGLLDVTHPRKCRL